MFGIEYPIFAFTHCRDVVAAVSKAGGLGVLGAVGFSPEQLEIELDLDRRARRRQALRRRHRDAAEGRRRRTASNADEMLRADPLDDRRRTHWRFVDELIDRFDLPPLPEGDGGRAACSGWTDEVAHQHVEIALAHPIKLIANALGSPPKDVIDRGARARREGRRARGQGRARAAPREQRRRHRDRAGLRGRRPHR